MKSTSTVIWITSQFVGYHKWEKAPNEVEFLRYWHRHLFKVKVGFRVTHDDRQLEFFLQKKKVDEFLAITYSNARFLYSCEQIAAQILYALDACFVEVSEDGENGAIVSVSEVKQPEVVKLEELPSLQKRESPFIGVEAEGPHRGETVLFVPGVSPVVEFEKAFRKVSNLVSRVYLGAGWNRAVSGDLLEAVLRTVAPDRLDVEVDNVRDIEGAGVTRGIISMTDDETNREKADYIKEISPSFVMWRGTRNEKVYGTMLDDPLYNHDREIAL